MQEKEKTHQKTQAEWEAEMAVKVIDYIRSELYMKLRYMQVALSALVPKEASQIRAFATDGEFLYFPPEHLLSVFRTNPDFLIRAYLHTILHCIFSHLWIGGNRDRELWHTACDIAVEYTIDGLRIPGITRILNRNRRLLYEELSGKERRISAALIYRLLLLKEETERRTLAEEFFTDDHCFWPKERKENAGIWAEKPDAEKKWDKIARQTDLNRRRNGEEEKEGEELFAAQLRAEKSRRNYADFLRKFSVMHEEMHVDLEEFDLSYYSFGLRHYGNMPLIEPLESREAVKIREFVIAIDTSDSTGGELVAGFLKETAAILMQSDCFFLQSRIRILQCDNQIRSDVEIRSERELSAFLDHFTLSGGGGTDFRPVFSHIDKLIDEGALKHLSGLLYFTDGKGIYPKKKPSYRTAFLFLEDYEDEKVPSWAMRQRLFGEEERGRKHFEY